MNDSYIDKIAKKYEIVTNLNTAKKLFETSLSVSFTLQLYEGQLDYDRLHEFRRKMRFICYSIMMTRFDITKAALKLIEFFINSSPDHLKAANHYLLYLVITKFLKINFSANKDEELIIKTALMTIFHSSINEKHVFKAIIDAAFADNSN